MNVLLSSSSSSSWTMAPSSDDEKNFKRLSTFSPLKVFLNPTKSSVWCGESISSEFGGVDPLARGVPCAAAAGSQLLGAPVGNIPFSRDAVETRINIIANIFDLLPSIGDSQT